VGGAAVAAAAAAPGPTRLEKLADVATMLFPVWVSCAAHGSLLGQGPDSWRLDDDAVLQLARCTTTSDLHYPLLARLLLLPLQALISGCTAFFHPASLSWITTQQFEWGVGLLMLAMGLSLTKADFQRVSSSGRRRQRQAGTENGSGSGR
jgi:hypothetical protein